MDTPHYHKEVTTSLSELRRVIGVDLFRGPLIGQPVIEVTGWNERQDTDLYSVGILTPAEARTLAGYLLVAAEEAERTGVPTPEPALVPPRQSEPRNVLAFCDGKHCVVVFPQRDGEDGQPPFSFDLRTPMPDGAWAGCFEVPEGGLPALQEEIERSAESVAAGEEE